uniref:Uncharacterized protein n=1 Tax=Avena sativa TaxID=4498 RepID=A0ACD5ZIL5_AVESA
MQRPIVLHDQAPEEERQGFHDDIHPVEQTQSDLNSLSFVSKQFYTIEAEHRDAMRIRCRLDPTTEALASLFSRFPNLAKVEIKYSGRRSSHGDQLNNQGLRLLSSHCPSLSGLTLGNCTSTDDTGLGYVSYCKNLRSLRLNFAPEITSVGLSQVVVSCGSLSVLHLVDCESIDNVEWLEYLGRYGSLEELVVDWPTEIGFTQEGIVTLIQSCPIRTLVLNGASILYDEGMKGSHPHSFWRHSSSWTASLTDAGIGFIVQAPCLGSLTHSGNVKNVTDVGMAALARSQKLESLTVIGCRQISREGCKTSSLLRRDGKPRRSKRNEQAEE